MSTAIKDGRELARIGAESAESAFSLLVDRTIEMGEVTIDRQPVRLHDFLEDAFEVASRSRKAQGLNFELDLPPGLNTMLADKDLFRIALNNLLTNAVKYSQPGGTITLSCQETEQMIRIAQGEKLAFAQKDIKMNGWAIEWRSVSSRRS